MPFVLDQLLHDARADNYWELRAHVQEWIQAGCLGPGPASWLASFHPEEQRAQAIRLLILMADADSVAAVRDAMAIPYDERAVLKTSARDRAWRALPGASLDWQRSPLCERGPSL